MNFAIRGGNRMSSDAPLLLTGADLERAAEELFIEHGEAALEKAEERVSIPMQPKKILTVSSGGGHWMQLMRLKPALEGHNVHYISVRRAYSADVESCRFYCVRDANRWSKIGLTILAVQMLWLTAKLRPEIVVSTGAAPGYFALRFGKMFGARTIWIDSIANTEEISLSGRLARKYADLWLTQSSHLARPGGPRFEGNLL